MNCAGPNMKQPIFRFRIYYLFAIFNGHAKKSGSGNPVQCSNVSHLFSGTVDDFDAVVIHFLVRTLSARAQARFHHVKKALFTVKETTSSNTREESFDYPFPQFFYESFLHISPCPIPTKDITHSETMVPAGPTSLFV